MLAIAYKDFIIGIFNARERVEKAKPELLAQDVNNYNINICCPKEIKIQQGLDINIGISQYNLVTLGKDMEKVLVINSK